MADKHPYISSIGALVKCIQQFRSSLPPTINASTLKKLDFAPKNESYLINTLRFINIIGDDEKPTKEAREVFALHDNSDFEKKFSEIVKNAYKDLFTLYQEKAWNLELNTLISYFRQTDQTSAIIGKRQAHVFKTLSSLGGHGPKPEVNTSPRRKAIAKTTKIAKVVKKTTDGKGINVDPEDKVTPNDFGLTVRIEINLPVSDDQGTYDKIFKSIRENLING